VLAKTRRAGRIIHRFFFLENAILNGYVHDDGLGFVYLQRIHALVLTSALMAALLILQSVYGFVVPFICKQCERSLSLSFFRCDVDVVLISTPLLLTLATQLIKSLQTTCNSFRTPSGSYAFAS
jgi:hypothetical protein